MSLTIGTLAHEDLTPDDLVGLRALFDAEYAKDFGDWDPQQPYGYAPHDLHVIARNGDSTIGHVGWGRRAISVGERELVIAGVGGVLVSDGARGLRLGEQLMTRAVESMRDADGIDFGYLGCREEVVPFYLACGWERVSAPERSLDREGRPSMDPAGQPLLIYPVEPSSVWPEGEIDLRGRAW